jgi:hypothetical protein
LIGDMYVTNLNLKNHAYIHTYIHT